MHWLPTVGDAPFVDRCCCRLYLATGATALAFNVATFVTLQFLARLFVTVMAILAGVFITEEFPAHARGWGMGAFTGLSTVGGGVAALLFATVDRWPFGWRGLYVVGLFALLLLPLLISHLPETTRFQSQRLAQPTAHLDVRWQPLLQLLRMYPSRLLVLSGIVLLFNLGGDAAFFLRPNLFARGPWLAALAGLNAKS
ncbi:MAG: hypothetical protein R2867_21035 [Caldilineaceae bacterium]